MVEGKPQRLDLKGEGNFTGVGNTFISLFDWFLLGFQTFLEVKADNVILKPCPAYQIQCNPDLVTHLVCQKSVTKSSGVTK